MSSKFVDAEAGEDSEGEGLDEQDSSEEEDDEDDEQQLRKEAQGFIVDENALSSDDNGVEEEEEERKPRKRRRKHRQQLSLDEEDLDVIEENTVRHLWNFSRVAPERPLSVTRCRTLARSLQPSSVYLCLQLSLSLIATLIGPNAQAGSCSVLHTSTAGHSCTPIAGGQSETTEAAVQEAGRRTGGPGCHGSRIWQCR